MTIYGTVKSNADLKGIPNATITVLWPSGAVSMQQAANNNGAFSVDVEGTERIVISSVGYATSNLPASYFAGKQNAVAYLFPKATDLPEVVVTPKKNFPWLWLIAAAVIAKASKII